MKAMTAHSQKKRFGSTYKWGILIQLSPDRYIRLMKRGEDGKMKRLMLAIFRFLVGAKKKTQYKGKNAKLFFGGVEIGIARSWSISVPDNVDLKR